MFRAILAHLQEIAALLAVGLANECLRRQCLLLWTNHRALHHTGTLSFVKPTADNAAIS
jgi:hypothetical protein